METEIAKCKTVLEQGGTILYPTDTIWGIGCDATNPLAVEKVFRIKRRAESKSLIIMLADPEELQHYVRTIPEVTWVLLKNADKPLTIIYPDSRNLAANVIAADGSVAIRIARHEFCRHLIRSFGKPIVSTSANLSGDSQPATFHKIRQEILDAVDYTADPTLDTTLSSKPSSIIKLSLTGEIQVIRE